MSVVTNLVSALSRAGSAKHALLALPARFELRARFGLRAILAGAIAAAGCLTAASVIAQRSEPDKSLDLSRFEPTFVEDFDSLDVSARGPGTRWIAHTPWNGDFGDAAFSDPRSGFPFTTVDGILRIEMRKVESGRWRAGLLSSVDMTGKGFAQQYGYFEISAKMPDGAGVWPAFWLIGVERTTTASEIDVVEYYGHSTDRYIATLHLWDKVGKPPVNKEISKRVVVPKGSLTRAFHTYGVEIDAENTVFYFDRKPVWRQATWPEHRQPMYLLLNLAAGGGWPIDAMPNPSVFEVDYVKVWKRKS